MDLSQPLYMGCKTCATPIPVEPDDAGRLPWEVRHDPVNGQHLVITHWPEVTRRATTNRLPVTSFRQER